MSPHCNTLQPVNHTTRAWASSLNVSCYTHCLCTQRSCEQKYSWQPTRKLRLLKTTALNCLYQHRWADTELCKITNHFPIFYFSHIMSVWLQNEAHQNVINFTDLLMSRLLLSWQLTVTQTVYLLVDQLRSNDLGWILPPHVNTQTSPNLIKVGRMHVKPGLNTKYFTLMPICLSQHLQNHCLLKNIE